MAGPTPLHLFMPEKAFVVNVHQKLVHHHTQPLTLLYLNAVPKAKKDGPGPKALTRNMPVRRLAVLVLRNLVTQMLTPL